MTRPLRQRHRRTVAALGVFLQIAFAAGIAARITVPSVNSLPAELMASSQQFEASVWKRSDLFTRSSIEVRLLRERADTGKFAIEFPAPKDFAKPDLLVYWAAGNPGTTDALPDNALLLGAFNSSALPLPESIASGNGVLVLYSLADNEIVEVSKPFTVQKQ
jgi:hypothetical protein